MLTNVKRICDPLVCPEVGPLWIHSKILPEMEGRAVLQDLIPDMNSLNLPRLQLRDGPLSLMNTVSMMVVVKPCTPLPAVVKLCTLMQCSEMLLCSEMGEGACSVP